MHASSYRCSSAHLLYALTLTASASALFGAFGLPVSLFVLLVWWQILTGARRETRATSDRSQSELALECPPRSAFSKVEVLVVLLMIGLLVGLLLPAASDSDPMRHAEISMKMVAKALKEYRVDHGEYPPVVLRDSWGQPLHSWRALLLPYLDEESLAAAYHFDEAWNGPHNALLAQYRPWHFRAYYPHHGFDEVTTCMQGLPLGDSFLLLEHEELHSNWLEPRSVNESVLERFAEAPSVGDGFWRQGFFASSYRGRLIVSPSHSFQVHPTQAGTVRELVLAPSTAREQIGIGQPLTRWHLGNAFHLVLFVLVALYPIRWLSRIRQANFETSLPGA